MSEKNSMVSAVSSVITYRGINMTNRRTHTRKGAPHAGAGHCMCRLSRNRFSESGTVKSQPGRSSPKIARFGRFPASLLVEDEKYETRPEEMQGNIGPRAGRGIPAKP